LPVDDPTLTFFALALPIRRSHGARNRSARAVGLAAPAPAPARQPVPAPAARGTRVPRPTGYPARGLGAHARGFVPRATADDSAGASRCAAGKTRRDIPGARAASPRAEDRPCQPGFRFGRGIGIGIAGRVGSRRGHGVIASAATSKDLDTDMDVGNEGMDAGDVDGAGPPTNQRTSGKTGKAAAADAADLVADDEVVEGTETGPVSDAVRNRRGAARGQTVDLNDDDYDIDDSYDDGDEVDGRAGRAFGEESFDTFAGMPDDDDFDDDEYDSWRLEVDASTPTHGKKQGSGRKGSDDGSETLTSGARRRRGEDIYDEDDSDEDESEGSTSEESPEDAELREAMNAERELEAGLVAELEAAGVDSADLPKSPKRSPPKKGTDLLMPLDYLSPALAQKMARNGHLSALSTGAIAAPEGQVEEDTDKALVTAGEKLELDAVLYSSDALDGDLGFPIVHDFSYAKSATPVFVMLPLDVISRDGQLQHVQALDVSLQTLKKIGVEGVMIDVWWGIVEREGPGLYDWKAYVELLRMVKKADLKLNAVMSFHACGANVGDYFRVTLPKWVLEAAEKDPDLFFTDQYGYRNPECISLWADNAKTLDGRTPLESYRDFMQSFRDEIEARGLMDVVEEISVGCGPCGELRYPAYPENKISPNSSQWQFPGIGEFQCYDQRALGNLARAGSEAGHIEWGGAGPHDAGGYNNLPHETGFFRAQHGSWDSEYGQFFLSWYSGELVEHGDRMLRCARSVFEEECGDCPTIAIKCAGVHWWYNSRSHAAELTAGYFNTRSGDNVPERDGYEPIVKICGRHGARLNFTCTEMRDIEHPFFSRCGPEGLLRQIRAAAARYGVKVAGENALCRFDQDAYDKIITNCRGEGSDRELWRQGALLPPMASFTFLRLSKELFEDDNFNSFVHFVARMANETRALGGNDEDKFVNGNEVLEALLNSEILSNLAEVRDETSSGFVAAQFSDL